MSAITHPKLFISYSWSNPEHEEWVLALATDLMNSGVEVILDKWDLKEGHDAVAFMETMVTDPSVRKVAMICDENYAKKADGRAGGVGTETQIISSEIYASQKQDKFVAVIRDKDATGKPFLPTYYKSRIYIDLSEPDQATENFEKLVRWVFDKPLYVKPPVGAAPAFLRDGEHVSLGTSALFKRSIDAIKNSKGHALGSFDEYCSAFSTNLSRFYISTWEGEFDEAVVRSIQEFVPYRNELAQLVTAIAQYRPEVSYAQRIHRLFEGLIPFMMNPPVSVSSYGSLALDNYKFIIHELFLHVVGIFLKHEHFELVDVLLRKQYFLRKLDDAGTTMMVDFDRIHQYVGSLEHRNRRLGSGRLSIRADMLRDRCSGSGLDFGYLMQADFVLFLRSELQRKNGSYEWWPETLLFAGRFHSAFEIFAKSSSKAYFELVKSLLGILAPGELTVLFEEYRTGTRQLPRWQFESIHPQALVGLNELATRP